MGERRCGQHQHRRCHTRHRDQGTRKQTHQDELLHHPKGNNPPPDPPGGVISGRGEGRRPAPPGRARRHAWAQPSAHIGREYRQPGHRPRVPRDGKYPPAGQSHRPRRHCRGDPPRSPRRHRDSDPGRPVPDEHPDIGRGRPAVDETETHMADELAGGEHRQPRCHRSTPSHCAAASNIAVAANATASAHQDGKQCAATPCQLAASTVVAPAVSTARLNTRTPAPTRRRQPAIRPHPPAEPAQTRRPLERGALGSSNPRRRRPRSRGAHRPGGGLPARAHEPRPPPGT